ncbi:DUF6527 family protein [Burkholderia multivorans]|uniref:DUF6527 family protein n=1 Tax=Burkholderia multivorans TaxID=87883 RepID=UPI001C238553|nr:hypothetical protein [Burkholderia multivorans]
MSDPAEAQSQQQYVNFSKDREVVTPLTPTDWTLNFNGEAISLWPSVGSWNLPYQSHCVIRQNKVIEAGASDNAKIDRSVQGYCPRTTCREQHLDEITPLVFQ